MIQDLRDFIDACERHGELKRVSAEVDWNLEMSHIAGVNEKLKGPALLFEKVKDYDIPVLMSAFTTRERLAICLGQDTDLSMSQLSRKWKELTKGDLVSPNIVNDPPVLENVIETPKASVLSFPSPYLYPRDGGRFLGTAHCLVTKDPDGGWTNLGRT